MAGENPIVVTATGHIRIGEHDEDLYVSRERHDCERCRALDKALEAAQKLQRECRCLAAVAAGLGVIALAEMMLMVFR